jgi:hypothetical protein
MKIKLYKLTSGDDVIATEVPLANKHSGLIRLNYPMYVLTSLNDDGMPLIALKLMNFYGDSQIVEIDSSTVMFQTSPRKPLEQFYLHTIQYYYHYYNVHIDNTLQTTLNDYLKDHQKYEEAALEDIFSRLVKPSSNNTIQ